MSRGFSHTLLDAALANIKGQAPLSEAEKNEATRLPNTFQRNGWYDCGGMPDVNIRSGGPTTMQATGR